MKARTIYRILSLAALIGGLLTAVSGCVFDEMDGDIPASGSPFTLSVTVVSGSSMGTRAPQHSDDYQENGTEAENTIDFSGNDFRFILFDNSGNYLQEIDGSTGKWNIFPSPVGSNNLLYYQMECEVEFPESVSPDLLAEFKTRGLKVMVVANWQSAKGQDAYSGLFYRNGGYQTLAQIWKDGTSYNFDYAPETENRTWLPQIGTPARKLIPMFGLAQASAFTARSGAGKLYSSATIPMQRAVAKIEVLDNLVNQPSLSVADVKMTAFNRSGRFIPDVDEAVNPDWDLVGTQVDRSSPPEGVQQNTDGLTFFRDIQNRKWIAYVPEMNLGEPRTLDRTTRIFNAETETGRPHLNVVIQSDLSYYEGGTYPVHFARYDANSQPTIPDESWNHILRNHIYRFSVNKVGVSVQLHLHVRPWVPDEDEEWDFTDHVTVQKELEWDADTYESFNEETGEIRLSFEKDKLLKGSFKITTPLNGRWYARLVPIGQAKTNAVSFVDEKGDILSPSSGEPAACVEISGLIDTNAEFPTVFYIRPTNYNNDGESRFRLEFLVENLGVWMKVPMLPDVNKYYTIVRESNMIN